MTKAYLSYLVESDNDQSVRAKTVGVDFLVKNGLQGLRANDSDAIATLAVVYCTGESQIGDLVMSEKFMREVNAISKEKVLFVILPRNTKSVGTGVVGDVVKLLPVNDGDGSTLDRIVRRTIGGKGKTKNWQPYVNGIIYVRLGEDGEAKKVFHEPICLPPDEMRIDDRYSFLLEHFRYAITAAEYDRTKAAPVLKKSGKLLVNLLQLYSGTKDLWELGKDLL